MTSEKSPLTKSAGSQLKPAFICVTPSPNEAISEPFLTHLTVIPDWTDSLPVAESATLQGRVAFVSGLASMSLEDTKKQRRGGDKINPSMLFTATNETHLHFNKYVILQLCSRENKGGSKYTINVSTVLLKEVSSLI